MTDPANDLSRLTYAERRILRLLAEGHTVKSVATALSTTTGSVNERLREARRKSGAGSSRELARRLRLHENRDEQIGVVGPGRSDAASPLAVAVGGRITMKGWLMILTLSTLAATAIALSTPTQQPGQVAKGDSDPLYAAAANNGPSVKELRMSFLAEPRDADWAVATERGLRNFYASIAGIGPDLRITCARTLCEVVGSTIPILTQRQSNALLRDLQGKSHDDAAAQLGLKRRMASFGSPRTPVPRIAFLFYFTRDLG